PSRKVVSKIHTLSCSCITAPHSYVTQISINPSREIKKTPQLRGF
ncbi:MAG: hypothetical protein ACI9X8_001755, partial [Pseudoalteromonas distincta]